jgi:hypothetical membrane protein
MARRVTTPWWAVVSAASAPTVLLTCATVARSMRIDSYDPCTQTLSALAVDGRGDWIMTAGFVVSAGCLIITAVGLRALPALPRTALAIAGCCGLATAALPERLGTATAHIAAAGLGFILLAIWPVLTVSPDATMPWPRRARWAISVSALLLGLVIWLCCDAWSGVDVGLSERAAATAEMLWPLVVVVSVRHLTQRRAHGAFSGMLSWKRAPDSLGRQTRLPW